MKLKSQIAIGIILLIFGYFMTNSIKSLMVSNIYSDSEDVKKLQKQISDLENDIEKLKTKNMELKTEIETNNSKNAKDNGYLADMLEKVENYENIIGLKAVQGNGITMVVKPIKNPIGQIQRNIDANDLVYIVNELWHSNAEAISIQDNRITFRTSISPSGDFIIINDDTRIPTTSEIKIKAIGDVEKLYTSMKMPGLFQNITKKVIIDGPFKEEDLIINSYEGSLDYNYMKPVKTGE